RAPSRPPSPWRRRVAGPRSMRAVVQRVSSASVTVADRVVGEIAHGLLALVGVEKDDGVADVEYIAGKISELRVFEDAEHHMNRSVHDVGGAELVVWLFSLGVSRRKGRMCCAHT